MWSSFRVWWTRDTALHSFVLCQFLVDMPFSVFNTYVVYQLQVIGFVIGTDSNGLPCTSKYCIVPWGGTRLDLNSLLLYLNALSFGIGGAITLLLCAYSDFWCKLGSREPAETPTQLLTKQLENTCWFHFS